ncbi:MAG: carboxylesterase/lipase family protein [Actinobacteria bacterium]|nr:carboxylesterase/lipase family protein [Actinomycetota bacterium]
MVEAACGTIMGTSVAGCERFLGIPYAEPPIGELRFAPPQPASSMRSPYAATRIPPAPPQHMVPGEIFDVGIMSEDCLRLNIWRPSGDRPRLPVIVWIHGGGFNKGAAHERLYDARELALRADAVVVTVEYRMGVLGGFVDLSDLDDPRLGAHTNNGLKDQALALRWVAENIRDFGGDSQNVTLAGESAGGLSVLMHLANSQTAKLFHQAIVISPAPVQILDAAEARTVGRSFLELAGLATARELLDAPIERLTAAQAQLRDEMRHGRLLVAFHPIIDGDTVRDQPVAAIAAGSAGGQPVMIGTTRNELAAVVKGEGEQPSEYDDALRRVCMALYEDESVVQGLIETYGTDGRAGLYPRPPLPVGFLQSDRLIRRGANRAMDALAAAGHKTFAFMFSWDGPIGIGSTHMIALPFLFGTTAVERWCDIVGDGPQARMLSGTIQESVGQFIRGAVPTLEEIGPWPQFSEDDRQTVHVRGAQPELIRDLWGHQRVRLEQILNERR